MARLTDRFLYGASGKGAPKSGGPGGERPRGAILRPFFRNLGTMVQYNLVMLLCFLPGIAWSGVNGILLLEQVAGLSLAQGFEAAYPLLSTWLMGMIPLWGLADLGACGAAAIFRRVLEGKQIRHWRDFSTAIRRGGRAAFLFGAARGTLWWLLLTAERFYFALVAGGATQFRVFQVLGVCIFLGVLNVEGLFFPALQGSGRKGMDALRSAVSQAIWHMPACLSVLALTVALPLLAALIPKVGLLLWGAYELAIGLSARLYAFTAVAALLGLGGVADEDEEED